MLFKGFQYWSLLKKLTPVFICRVRLMSACVFFYSLMAFLTGYSAFYWQLILLRFGFGAGYVVFYLSDETKLVTFDKRKI